MSRALESRGPLDLLVWPEAAIPGWLAEMPGWDSLFAALAREGHTPIFTGGIHAVSADVYYNAAFFYDSTGQWRPYPVYGKQDRKSTRLNSSHGYISYAVFCLKKKRHTQEIISPAYR